MELGTEKLAKPEQWRVTIHYESGDHSDNYGTLVDVLKWAGQAIQQMGWPNRKHSKVTIERVSG